MLRTNFLGIVPVACSLVSLAVVTTPAIAQTTYPFTTSYETNTSDIPTDIPGILKLIFQATSTDAPYGLTNANSLAYAKIDLNTGAGIFGTDPTALGAPNLPKGFFTLQGSGNNKFFGEVSGTSLLDPTTLINTLSGNVTITGGEGIFQGAIGNLTLSATETFSPDFSSSQGQFSVNGSIVTSAPTTVSEPTFGFSLLAFGALNAGYFLKRKLN